MYVLNGITGARFPTLYGGKESAEIFQLLCLKYMPSIRMTFDTSNGTMTSGSTTISFHCELSNDRQMFSKHSV